MSINLEIKGQLAKLLATEDLIVEHQKVETAMFNVQSRVLTLPIWKKASNEVYDMLIAHEVGHALFTPNEDWESDVPKSILNVTEDARIEKLMKRKYPGLPKTFYRGYNYLSDEDFFCIEDEDVDEMNLADKINLYFKIGSFTKINFTDEENEIVKIVSNAETFQDAQDAARAIYKYCKSQKDERVKEQKMSSKKSKEDEEFESNSQSSSHSSSDFGGFDQSDNVDGEEEEETQEQGSNYSDDIDENLDGIVGDMDLGSKTDSNLREKLKNLIDKQSTGTSYVEIPKVNLDTFINSNSEVHGHIEEVFTNFLNDCEDREKDAFEYVDSQYCEFRNSSKKEVSFLMKEFECKKSASAYSRATTSRTGILNTSKLHTYKYNEDLFKKVTIIPEGKNHGLIFILDWSGSMGEYLKDTIEQLYKLVWFCSKSNIPFNVYAFTGEFNVLTYDDDGVANILQEHYIPKDGQLSVSKRVSLMEFFNSDCSTKDLEKQMLNIWRCVYAITRWVKYILPHRMCLSGTPLNESVIALHQIIPAFKKKYNLEKVNCVILTDGEANALLKHSTVQRDPLDEPYVGVRRMWYRTHYLRNRKTGNVHELPEDWSKLTDVLLKDLGETFPNVNTIGIRIICSRDANTFIHRYCGYGDEFDKVSKEWRKERCFQITSSGYDKYFGLSSADISQDSSFSVKSDATKTQIKSAFIKSLRTKKLNKKILGSFVDLIV